MAKKANAQRLVSSFITKHEKFLSFEQLKEISKMSEPEKEKYITWLSERSYKGTSEEWIIFTNRQQMVNSNIRKIDKLTIEQQKGIKPLTGNEVREYIVWLYIEKNYIGGTVDEWQKFRIEQTKKKVEIPVVITDDNSGVVVERIKI